MTQSYLNQVYILIPSGKNIFSLIVPPPHQSQGMVLELMPATKNYSEPYSDTSKREETRKLTALNSLDGLATSLTSV